MKSKRSVLLTLPILLMPITLTSCDKYSYSDPKKMIKNMWSSYISLNYPYIDKTDATVSEIYHTPEGYVKIESMADIDNVIIDGFNKVKSFKKVDKINPSTDKRILFSFHHQISQESVSLTYCTLYPDGNLYCHLFYVTGDSDFHNETMQFTFDADIANEMYENCYAEFDKAKVELEEFPEKTMTFDYFFQTVDENNGEYVDWGSNSYNFIDQDKQINAELKKLIGELKEENLVTTFPINDYGQIAFDYNAINSVTDGYYHFEYYGFSFTTWSLSINEDGTYVDLRFHGWNKYHMRATSSTYYRINPEVGKSIVENARIIAARACK